MNIEEAKEKIKEISYGTGIFLTNYEVNSKKVLEILDQLDKPKPEVPQCVTDWIEECEEEGLTLKGLFSNSDMPAKIFDWIFGSDENCRLMAEAWINGYTVEKEKLYTVEVPNPNIIGNEHTVLMKNGFGQIVMLRVCGDDWRTDKGYQITESEIRKDFDWAWREGMKKEVTDL